MDKTPQNETYDPTELVKKYTDCREETKTNQNYMPVVKLVIEMLRPGNARITAKNLNKKAEQLLAGKSQNFILKNINAVKNKKQKNNVKKLFIMHYLNLSFQKKKNE